MGVSAMQRSIRHFGAAASMALAACLMLGAAAAAGQDKDGDGKAGSPATGILSMLPADSVTGHVLEAGGARLAYRATAGTIGLRAADASRVASVYYTAYTLEGAEPRQRPVTFVFNGGPGAASVYLHLGLVGPRVADFGPRSAAAGATLRPNPDTWLRFTDLVLVDPVGTGWSRAASDDKAKEFYGAHADASWLAKFVSLYLLRTGRTASPKYLLGESYGGFRAAKLARALQREQGIAVSGIVMVSPFLEGALQIRSGRLALGAALVLPSIAAAELERTGRYTPEALAAADRFAMTDYLVAQAGPPPEGKAAAAYYGRIASITGLPVDVVTRARGFVADAYMERAAADREQVVSPYDAAFTIPDPYPESIGETGADPMLDGFLRELGRLFVAYAWEALGYRSEITFRVLSSEVSRAWDWGGSRAQAGVADDLRELLALNPGLRVLVAHGRTDLVTPYAASRYVIDHLPGAGIRARAALKTYPHGHMFYLAPAARAAFTADAAAFYAAAERP